MKHIMVIDTLLARKEDDDYNPCDLISHNTQQLPTTQFEF